MKTTRLVEYFNDTTTAERTLDLIERLLQRNPLLLLRLVKSDQSPTKEVLKLIERNSQTSGRCAEGIISLGIYSLLERNPRIILRDENLCLLTIFLLDEINGLPEHSLKEEKALLVRKIERLLWKAMLKYGMFNRGILLMVTEIVENAGTKNTIQELLNEIDYRENQL